MVQEWFVAHTQVQQEARAARELGNQEIPSFLPQARIEVRLNSGLLVERIRPLFSRYLFFALDPEASERRWAPVLNTKGIRSIVGYREGMEKPPNVAAEIMQELKSRLSADGFFPLNVSRPKYLTPGTLMRVLFGPFRDQNAPVQADHGSRVEVLLKLCGKMHPIKLPKDCLVVAA